MILKKINNRYYVGRAGVSYSNLKDALKYIEDREKYNQEQAALLEKQLTDKY